MAHYVDTLLGRDVRTSMGGQIVDKLSPLRESSFYVRMNIAVTTRLRKFDTSTT